MKNEKISKEVVNESLRKTGVILNSSSMKEEEFMYLSIIVAILSYTAQIYWLTWIFGVKGAIEAVASIIMAFKECKIINNK